MEAPASLYPAAPRGIPVDLARPDRRYRLQAAVVLLAMIPFLVLYFALLAGSVALMVWAVWPNTAPAAAAPEAWEGRLFLLVLRVSLLGLALMLFAFLLKWSFARGHEKTSGYLRVTEEDQPELFRFLRSLCEEIGCPVPAKVYLSHDVNAAVLFSTSLLNLITPPRKSLLIGLGLVNGMNLVEFKALLAHELGHFSQRTLRLSAHVQVAYRAIGNMVQVRDRWDQWVLRGVDLPWVSIFAVPLYTLAEVTRRLLAAAFRPLQRAHLAMLRQMEFNADLVAVSAAGSDAPVHLLARSDFNQACLQRCGQDLALAAELGRFTRDLFFHQERAADLVRAEAKNNALGRIPESPSDPSRSVTVFEPGDASTLAMWADHPSHYDRERNAKRRYFRSPQDDRPAWLLFQDLPAVREEVTRQFYRDCLKLDPDEPLTDPESMEAFLAEERAEVSFDPRYHGVYDHRFLEALTFEHLAATNCPNEPRNETEVPEDLPATLLQLYSSDLGLRLTTYRRHLAESDALRVVLSRQAATEGDQFEFRGRQYPVAEAEMLLTVVELELAEDRRTFAEFDRSVFDLHRRLAERAGRREELEQRYRFHLDLQQVAGFAWQQTNQVKAILGLLLASKHLPWEQVGELEASLANVHAWVGDLVERARHLRLPPLTHLTPGKSVAELLPPVPPANLRSAESHVELDVRSVAEFQERLDALVTRLSWLQVKSLTGILKLQEELVAQATRPGPQLSPPD